ncbi:ATP-binding cassette domain-containing protein [Gemella sp. GH3]|uniref:ATP-binding cassette domain-containing protein n=1 Tax=unclassified Gemella TaxID=2624949 RepID=UPI0015D0AD7C|nr:MULTISPECIES: ATP-binding cassette domain-containing protein [unclassified Gemella]MBF0713748.1 ATP-binding cassette domain-containing protein [Gemella sp. GH3.1]NYS50700.1 ATP-binding cassette domain-containing protein [Gemella sp. GH3]
MKAIVSIKNVTKKFKDKKIFDNFSVDIFEGECVAIVGVSGSGKTTLLNMIGGLEKIDEGSIFVKDVKVVKNNYVKLHRNIVSFLFQNFALVDEWTVEKNLLLALSFRNKKEQIMTLENALEKVGLADKLKTKVYQLSDGEQQRVALARLMLQNKPIVLADEPTASLDTENRNVVFSILKKLQSDGKTIIIVTHDRELANQCDKIVEI